MTAVEIFPLVIATSFVIKDDKRVFKSEYIVPQLIMQAARELEIDGIGYLSKHCSDFWAYPYAVNLAILIPDYKVNNKNFWEKSDKVRLTNPICMGLLTIEDILKMNNKNYKCYVSEQYKDKSGFKDIILNNGKIKYINTLFAAFDEKVLGGDYDIINENEEI